MIAKPPSSRPHRRSIHQRRLVAVRIAHRIHPGLSTIVKRGHAETGIDWSLAMKQTGSSTWVDPQSRGTTVRNDGDIYSGLDNHGRVSQSRWESTSGGYYSANQDDFLYAYDKNGNRLYRMNGLDHAFDELYHADGASSGYDKLDRLTEFQRGTMTDADSDGTYDTVSTSSRSQGWALDALGNWTSLTQSGGGSNETRTHDAQNGIKTINGGTALTYSNNGELRVDKAGQTYEYDAWGRLVSVDPDGAGGTAATTYSYDALFRRITEDADGAGSGSPTIHLYYTPAWQVIEEREDTLTSAKVQHVWSPVYIDAIVLTDRDLDADGNFTDAGERQYVMQDANFNVTGLIGDTNSGTAGNQWGVIERYVYDPYGKPTVLDANWATDSDGYSDVYNRYMFQGGRHTQSLQLSHFRFRDLHVTLGRWTRQDPMGYIDGLNAAQAYKNMPTVAVDPTGEWIIKVIKAIGKIFKRGGDDAAKKAAKEKAEKEAKDKAAKEARDAAAKKPRGDVGDAEDIRIVDGDTIVDAVASITEIDGTTVVVDIAVYQPGDPKDDRERANTARRAILKGRDELKARFKERGFKKMRIRSRRHEDSSSGNPGHDVDREVDLE